MSTTVLYVVKHKIFLANLRKVFEPFIKLKVALKPKKCRLGLFEIKYVGRVISINGTIMRNETITKVFHSHSIFKKKHILSSILSRVWSTSYVIENIGS